MPRCRRRRSTHPLTFVLMNEPRCSTPRCWLASVAGAAIAQAHGLTYPEALDRLAGARLDDLDAPGAAPYP
jgi:hypothetical protein